MSWPETRPRFGGCTLEAEGTDRSCLLFLGGEISGAESISVNLWRETREGDDCLSLPFLLLLGGDKSEAWVLSKCWDLFFLRGGERSASKFLRLWRGGDKSSSSLPLVTGDRMSSWTLRLRGGDISPFGPSVPLDASFLRRGGDRSRWGDGVSWRLRCSFEGDKETLLCTALDSGSGEGVSFRILCLRGGDESGTSSSERFEDNGTHPLPSSDIEL